MLPEKEMTFNKNEGGENGKKILRAVGAVIVVTVFATGIFLWQESYEPENGQVSENIPSFTPPVYEMEEYPDVLTHPLFLPVGAKGLVEITPEVERLIVEFKRKILARVAIERPLSNQEKSVLKVSILTSEKPPIGILVIADQTVLDFTPDEVIRIEDALQK